jgi:diacylglycerol kinase family enzyme
MASIVFYHNSKAGRGNLPQSEDELRKFFFRHDIVFRYPESRDELLANLDQDLKDGRDYVFSVGGDGTANTIAQKLINHDTRLMIIPSGTANDIAGGLGLSSNIKKIAHVFHAQHTRLIDVIDINGKIMVSNGGVGIAARVAQEINDKRTTAPIFKNFMKAVGHDIYGLQLVQHLLTRPFPLERVFIESPDLPNMGVISTPLILVNNQPLLAGKFRVAPGTQNSDGKFNVAIFHHQDKMSFIQTVVRILRQGMTSTEENVTTFETSELTLTPMGATPLSFFGDGEQFPLASSYHIKVIPQSLRVCAVNDQLLTDSGHTLDDIPTLQ